MIEWWMLGVAHYSDNAMNKKGGHSGTNKPTISLFVFSIRYWDIGAAVIKFDPNPMGFVQRRGSRYL